MTAEGAHGSCGAEREASTDSSWQLANHLCWKPLSWWHYQAPTIEMLHNLLMVLISSVDFSKLDLWNIKRMRLWCTCWENQTFHSCDINESNNISRNQGESPCIIYSPLGEPENLLIVFFNIPKGRIQPDNVGVFTSSLHLKIYTDVL